jgi:hypothetical protein
MAGRPNLRIATNKLDHKRPLDGEWSFKYDVVMSDLGNEVGAEQEKQERKMKLQTALTYLDQRFPDAVNAAFILQQAGEYELALLVWEYGFQQSIEWIQANQATPEEIMHYPVQVAALYAVHLQKARELLANNPDKREVLEVKIRALAGVLAVIREIFGNYQQAARWYQTAGDDDEAVRMQALHDAQPSPDYSISKLIAGGQEKWLRALARWKESIQSFPDIDLADIKQRVVDSIADM